MSRGLTAAVETALGQDNIRWALLFVAEFDSGTVRMWSGIGSITWDGNEYIGGGDLLSWSGITETMGLDANGTSVILSGIPSDLLSVALQEDYQGRNGQIYLAILDDQGEIVADPITCFDGQLDIMQGEEEGETATIEVKLESALALFSTSNPRWLSNTSQQALYPGDRGLQFIAALETLEIRWGD